MRQRHHCQVRGYKRVCEACGNMLFPRTDPVVIMLVIDEENDRCLLGRNVQFPTACIRASPVL